MKKINDLYNNIFSIKINTKENIDATLNHFIDEFLLLSLSGDICLEILEEKIISSIKYLLEKGADYNILVRNDTCISNIVVNKAITIGMDNLLKFLLELKYNDKLVCSIPICYDYIKHMNVCVQSIIQTNKYNFKLNKRLINYKNNEGQYSVNITAGGTALTKTTKYDAINHGTILTAWYVYKTMKKRGMVEECREVENLDKFQEITKKRDYIKVSYVKSVKYLLECGLPIEIINKILKQTVYHDIPFLEVDCDTALIIGVKLVA